jgi:fermentation-respiration switch protein FrsA (DUF1100 family)
LEIIQKEKMKTRIFIVALITMLVVGSNLTAQTPSSEFDNKGVANKSFQPVTFKNNKLKMAGNLFLPANFDKNKKYPAIVCVHPGGGVKEQTSGLYAQKLSMEGYITLAFDASHQGESEGEPRFLEDPAKRVEDIRTAIDYLATLSFVDSGRIGLLGICAGGGYALSAAQTDHRIKAVAVASPVDIGLTNRMGWDGKATIEDQIGLLDKIGIQRTAEANGAEPMYVNYVPEVVDQTTILDMKEAHDYYRTPRAQHPNSTNRMLFRSMDKIIAFDAFSQLETLLTQPVLIIVGTNAGSRWQGELAYKKAKGPKELWQVKGATHMDLYDIPQYVSQVVAKMKAFYGTNL